MVQKKMEINYITDDKSIAYKLVYITGRRLRGYRRDKSHTIVTQCLLYRNGLIIGFGEVVKCEKDKDNTTFAQMLATKKVMSLIPFRDIRCKIWNLLKEEHKNFQ